MSPQISCSKNKPSNKTSAKNVEYRKIERPCSSETSRDFQRRARRYNPEDEILHLSVCLSMTLQPFVGPWPLLQSLDLLHSRTPSTGDQPVTSRLPAYRTAQTQNKLTQTSMPQLGFELNDPNVWAGKNILCLRPCSHRHRLEVFIRI
jgi:hypothetical protein